VNLGVPCRASCRCGGWHRVGYPSLRLFNGKTEARTSLGASLDELIRVNNGAVIAIAELADGLEWRSCELAAQKHCDLPREGDALLVRPGLQVVGTQSELAGNVPGDARQVTATPNPRQSRQVLYARSTSGGEASAGRVVTRRSAASSASISSSAASSGCAKKG
jgi:hypothetical protein